ncbi:hypothetical protein PC112_g16940 [Phytophthora cactorum]|nr:hypothetical protein PC112_g16940 [Phytophthora cactorum]KAG3130817.1 hypothetical protein C6341_g23604 [Phytophthora cactorum]
MAPAPVNVLLMPEDILGPSEVTTPVYGAVVAVNEASTTIGLLSAPHATVEVPTAIVRNRRVDNSEHGAGAPGEWLRKPVVGVSNGRFMAGQVTAYDRTIASIRTFSGTTTSAVDDLVEVAPVLYFLTGKSELSAANLTRAELTQHHHTILDRLGGDGGRGSTRAISRLLAGFISPRQQPKPDDTLRWINERTGLESTVSVRHVIDYAYCIDGGHRITSSIRNRLGARFDDDPEFAQPQVPASTYTDQSADPNTTAEPHRAENNPALDSAKQNHAKILAAIADDPALIRFFLGVCQTGATKRSAESPMPPAPQRRRLEPPSDLLDVSSGAERRSKHAFNPTRTQKATNVLFAAPSYEAVHFSGSYENNLAVIDLALPFGWTGSPAHYGASGGAVSFLLARESPRSLDPGDLDDEPLFSFVWIDDHVLIEADRGNRLRLAETALRLSMIAVLGPEAVNESKFSSWETELEALDLLWNSEQRTVSMSTSKVKKALKKIAEVVTAAQVSRHSNLRNYLALCGT